MTKYEALHKYFEDFMRTVVDDDYTLYTDLYLAYPSTNVPKDAILPYLTYEFVDNGFGDGDTSITVNIWTRTFSEEIPNRMAEKLRRYVEDKDMVVCDTGAIWVKTGSPFSQPLKDENDASLRGRYINLTLEYLTR